MIPPELVHTYHYPELLTELFRPEHQLKK